METPEHHATHQLDLVRIDTANRLARPHFLEIRDGAAEGVSLD